MRAEPAAFYRGACADQWASAVGEVLAVDRGDGFGPGYARPARPAEALVVGTGAREVGFDFADQGPNVGFARGEIGDVVPRFNQGEANKGAKFFGWLGQEGHGEKLTLWLVDGMVRAFHNLDWPRAGRVLAVFAAKPRERLRPAGAAALKEFVAFKVLGGEPGSGAEGEKESKLAVHGGVGFVFAQVMGGAVSEVAHKLAGFVGLLVFAGRFNEAADILAGHGF